MTEYHERMWPARWIPIATALVIPASLLVLAPISLVAGAITATVLYVACLILFVTSAPHLTVRDGSFLAGRASIPREFIGEVEAFSGDDAAAERGHRLNARAWLLIRGGVRGVVKVQILDENDPTPYWLISSRRPDELAAAIQRSPAAR